LFYPLWGVNILASFFVLIHSFMDNLDPQLREFILFCFRRCGKEWPAIYDEMAVVAGQKLFNGLGHDELKQMGLSLRVSNLDRTIQLVKQVISQNQ